MPLCLIRSIKYIKYTKIMPRKTKAAERTIILPSQLVEILKQYKTRVRTQWLFPSPNKTEDVPRDPCAFRKRLAKILENAGCKHVPFHPLRHIFATHASSNGIDPKTLAGILGHTKASFTLDRYTHVTTDMQKQASSIVGNYITDIFGKELKPWESDEKADQEQ